MKIFFKPLKVVSSPYSSTVLNFSWLCTACFHLEGILEKTKLLGQNTSGVGGGENIDYTWV